MDAVVALVGDGPDRLLAVDMFLMLGADTPFRPGLAANCHYLDEVGPRLDQRGMFFASHGHSKRVVGRAGCRAGGNIAARVAIAMGFIANHR
jgi:hypothetical protein